MAQQVEPEVGVLKPVARLPVQTAVGRRLRINQLKGLILAQNERWRRGLGMQVVRET